MKKYYGVKEEKNILQTIKRRKANWIGYILRRKCLLKPVIEGNIEGGVEVMGRRGRRRKKYWMNLRKREGTEK
jgi:hypothetical protein